MKALKQLTASLRKKTKDIRARPPVDVAIQGSTIAEARTNLKEGTELFFETAIVKPALRFPDISASQDAKRIFARAKNSFYPCLDSSERGLRK